MAGITKGYTKKPDSTVVKQVVKGFTDNPFLKKKPKDRAGKANELRHDSSINHELNYQQGNVNGITVGRDE